MNAFLLKLLELSLQAGVLTIVILLVRLVLRKLPAKYLCVLWMIVAARLIIPFSFESSIAPMGSIADFTKLFPKSEEREVHVYQEVYMTSSEDEVDYYLVEGSEGKLSSREEARDEMDYNSSFGADYQVVEKQMPSMIETYRNIRIVPEYIPVIAGIWATGAGVLLLYGILSCLRVRHMVKNAIHYEDNIWLCEGLESPFLFGWIRPKVYLPTSLEDAQMRYVIDHEKAHIARGDNYAKLIGYALLAVYWFHPLVWVAYIMFCKDVERACDEKVIAGFDVDDRKGYADALLQCSMGHKFAISHPLAFGELDVKKRIGGILKYHKPARWLVAAAVILCVAAVAGCFIVRSDDAGKQGEASSPTPVIPEEVSPTPTAAPVEPTPTTAVVKLTPTPLPPSDLTLLGKVAEGTVIAVPMGQTAEVDLDGDGTKDVITCGYEGFGKGEIFEKLTGGSWRLSEALFQLNINGRTFRDNEIREEYWNDGPGFTTYYIFDVNTEDKYKEIGLYFDGPSGDPSTALYRYIDGKLYCVGVFESATLESDYSWNSMDYEDVPYEEMVQAVDRTNFCISVHGDGTIFCGERTVFYETTSVVREYKLWNSSMGKAAILQETIRDRYEFTGWQYDREDLNVKTKKDFTAYAAPIDMSVEFQEDLVLVEIPKGTRVSFYAYYPDNGWTAGWVQLFYGENLENSAWIYEGTDKQGKSVIYLPNGTEDSSWDLFVNLSMAG